MSTWASEARDYVTERGGDMDVPFDVNPKAFMRAMELLQEFIEKPSSPPDASS